MRFVPHDYQEYAISFMERHKVSAIFLDMGLGKTSITLTAIHNLLFDYFDVHKVLVVAPLRVARNTWKEEILKWDHLNELRYSVVVGTQKERLKALNEKTDVYIINRENIPWLIQSRPFDYDMVVIDELSSFKNHQAKRFKELMRVRGKVKRIVGLTGTPSTNGLMDLFAEFKLLDMGERLGRFIGAYRHAYFLPDKRNGEIIYSYKPLPGAEEKIYQKISDITISMKAAAFLKMPKLITRNFEVRLSDAEGRKYNKLMKELALCLENGEVTAANAAVLSGKLTQLANGAIYTDDEKVEVVHSKKLDALEDMVESMNGKPVLVAYWYKHDLERIIERLTKLKVKFSKLDTEESIHAWNEGKLEVGLIHPASAGHGLNLQQGGSTIIWFGLTWSLELYQQTNARLYRQGQMSDIVMVQHIITKDTIDEKICKALEKKNLTQSALIDAVRVNLRRQS